MPVKPEEWPNPPNPPGPIKTKPEPQPAIEVLPDLPDHDLTNADIAEIYDTLLIPNQNAIRMMAREIRRRRAENRP